MDESASNHLSIFRKDKTSGTHESRGMDSSHPKELYLESGLQYPVIFWALIAMGFVNSARPARFRSKAVARHSERAEGSNYPCFRAPRRNAPEPFSHWFVKFVLVWTSLRRLPMSVLNPCS